MSIACDGLDTRYQVKIYLPFESGNMEKPPYLIAGLVCCVTRTLEQIRVKMLGLYT